MHRNLIGKVMLRIGTVIALVRQCRLTELCKYLVGLSVQRQFVIMKNTFVVGGICKWKLIIE